MLSLSSLSKIPDAKEDPAIMKLFEKLENQKISIQKLSLSSVSIVSCKDLREDKEIVKFKSQIKEIFPEKKWDYLKIPKVL